jgi:hypothetical protein
MREIPSDILTQYSVILRKRAVPSGSESYYLKWLRYYLDYCSKYNLPDTSSKSLNQFLQKLRDKKQTEVQLKQAGHAVSLYLDMEKAKDLDSRLHENDGLEGFSNKKILPSSPVEEMRQPLTFEEYRATGTAKTQWVKAIAEMTAVIKTKHYSAKTLKSYGHWTWKFQRFKKDTDPALLTTEDVKAFLTWLAVSCKVSASSQN